MRLLCEASWGEARRGEFYLRRGEARWVSDFTSRDNATHLPSAIVSMDEATRIHVVLRSIIAQWTQYILCEFNRRIDKRESITNVWQKSYNWYLYHEFIELVHQLPMNISFGQTKQNSTTKKKKIGNIKYNNKRYTFLFFFFQLFSIFFFICIYIYILYIYLLFLYL